MHRTHGRAVETFSFRGVPSGSKNPPSLLRRDVFGTSRSPWEPRLYGGVIGGSNVNFSNGCEVLKVLKSKSNLLYCCPQRGFPASICSDPRRWGRNVRN